MDASPVEYQCKLMNNRVDNVSKHFSYFFQGFSSYARKVALLRDKGDDLVDVITSYADTEPHNGTTRKQLHEFAHWLAMVQDFRHLSAARIMTHLTPTLQTYSKTTSELKTNIKKCTTLSEKTKSSLEVANKIRTKNGDNSAVFHTTFETYRTNVRETTHQVESLRLQAREFEEKKLKDTQRLLSNFALSELMFHCRAVEMYTAAYRSLQGISTERDLAEFLDAYERMDDGADREEKVEISGHEAGRQTAGFRVPIRSSTSQSVLYGDNGDSEGSETGDYASKESFNRSLPVSLNGQDAQRRPQTAIRGPQSVGRRQNIQLEDSDTD